MFDYIKRKRIVLIYEALLESNSYIIGMLEKGNINGAIQVMESCQNCAINLGTQIEGEIGLDTKAVGFLEKYCEGLYTLSQAMDSVQNARFTDGMNRSYIASSEKYAIEELELNKKILLFNVDFRQINLDDDLLEKKVNHLLELISQNDGIVGLWYIDMKEVVSRKLLRPESKELYESLFEKWGKTERCYLDFSRDENSAAALADAYYGTVEYDENNDGKKAETGIVKIMKDMKKPVMLADFHLVEGYDGYYQSKYRVRIHEKLYELYKEFKRVCELHNIKYYAYAGTLIGAVRDHGIIPWDDDLDVMMFREDYEKLCSVASEFKGKYELQTPYTHGRYLYPMANFRDNDTTAIIYRSDKRDLGLGMFMDIFVIDSMPDSNEKFKEETEMLAGYYNAAMLRMGYLLCRNGIETVKDKTLKDYILRDDWDNVFRECDAKREKYDEPNSRQVILFAELVGMGHTTQVYNREWFADTIMMPFGDTEMPVPSGYDPILKKTFGNYMVPYRGKSSHGDTFYDVDRGFLSYVLAGTDIV